MEAMVSNPKGGKAAFLPTKGRAYLKLQKVGGYWGYANNIFMV
jgi:hypothetical protein